MTATLANKDTFPAYPVEVKVRVEKIRQEKTIHRMFVCDATGFATIAVFGELPQPIVEGKCYSFMVSLGKEFRGQRDLVMNGTSYPYSEIPALRVPDDPVTVTTAIIQPGYRYCVRARVRKDGVTVIPRDDRTLYLWTITLSDGKTQCPVKIWGDATDPLPDVRDGLYDIYCLSYVPSQNPQYPVGHFDAKNARWVCREANTVQSSIPPAPAPEPSAPCVPTPEPNPAPAPVPVSEPPKPANFPRRIVDAIGGTPHLPTDCVGIMLSLGEIRLIITELEKIYASAVEYEKIHGLGTFYKNAGSVDSLAVLRDGSVSMPDISAATVNFGIDVLELIRVMAPMRRV